MVKSKRKTSVSVLSLRGGPAGGCRSGSCCLDASGVACVLSSYCVEPWFFPCCVSSLCQGLRGEVATCDDHRKGFWRLCSWHFFVSFCESAFPRTVFVSAGVASMFWDFGSLHQKPRVGGTRGRVRRDGSDGWRSPFPRGDNTGEPDRVPPSPTIACRSRRLVVNIVIPCGHCTRWRVLFFQTGTTLRRHFLHTVAAAVISVSVVAATSAAVAAQASGTLRSDVSVRRCGDASARCCGTGKLLATYLFWYLFLSLAGRHEKKAEGVIAAGAKARSG